VKIVVRSGRARHERFAFRGFFESIVPDERAITQLALRGVSNFAQSAPKFNRASEMPDAVHQMRLMSGQARTREQYSSSMFVGGADNGGSNGR
jgi:hypothetical protein